MTKIKPGLGRGLDALINPQLNENSESKLPVSLDKISKDDGHSFNILVKIPVENIKPNPYQPRTEFDEEALQELKMSILENGLIQPITVRRTGQNQYELISGERRLRACKDIGYKDIPSYIIKVETKEAMLALSLIENIQREQLNPIEVALAYQRLMTECNMSQDEIAKQVGKNRSTVTNTIRLLKLPKEIQQSIIENKISAGHARALINIPDEQLQISIKNQIIKKNLSVRNVEQLVKKALTEEKKSHRQKAHHDSDSIHVSDLEDKLRNIFGTKVICKQKKDGRGEITIEFYSNDELERLLDLFNSIGH